VALVSVNVYAGVVQSVTMMQYWLRHDLEALSPTAHDTASVTSSTDWVQFFRVTSPTLRATPVPVLDTSGRFVHPEHHAFCDIKEPTGSFHAILVTFDAVSPANSESLLESSSKDTMPLLTMVWNNQQFMCPVAPDDASYHARHVMCRPHNQCVQYRWVSNTLPLVISEWANRVYYEVDDVAAATPAVCEETDDPTKTPTPNGANAGHDVVSAHETLALAHVLATPPFVSVQVKPTTESGDDDGGGDGGGDDGGGGGGGGGDGGGVICWPASFAAAMDFIFQEVGADARSLVTTRVATTQLNRRELLHTLCPSLPAMPDLSCIDS